MTQMLIEVLLRNFDRNEFLLIEQIHYTFAILEFLYILFRILFGRYLKFDLFKRQFINLKILSNY